MKETGVVLAVQPDARRARFLHRAIAEKFEGKVILVDSADAALSTIDTEVPDIVLLDPLIAPGEEDYLLGYLRAHSEAGHVQAIGIPYDHAQAAPVPDTRKRSFFAWMRGSAPAPMVGPCDLETFAADLTAYITSAREIRDRVLERRGGPQPTALERRDGPRWTSSELSCVASVHLASGERVDLVNVSWRGALVRSAVRPTVLSVKHAKVDVGAGAGLRFDLTSGAEIHAPGRVIRCDVRTLDTGVRVYDVAYCFDDTVHLNLPLVVRQAREDA